jgi:hypothetical protein
MDYLKIPALFAVKREERRTACWEDGLTTFLRNFPPLFLIKFCHVSVLLT